MCVARTESGPAGQRYISAKEEFQRTCGKKVSAGFSQTNRCGRTGMAAHRSIKIIGVDFYPQKTYL